MKTQLEHFGYLMLATLFDLATLNLKVSPYGRNEAVGLRDGYYVATLCDLAPLNLKVSPYGRDDKRWGYCGATLWLLWDYFFFVLTICLAYWI